MRLVLSLPSCGLALFAAAFHAPVLGQCATQWSPGDGVPGVGVLYSQNTCEVRAMTVWDPDGAGPAPAGMVLAGQFTIAGNTLANQIAFWDPSSSTWTPLGMGIDGTVWALTTRPNGELIVGGHFVTVGGLVINGAASWNGSSWSPMGPGPGGGVLALATLPSGDVVAGGSFGVRSWNGVVWSITGVINANRFVRALEVMPNGDLLVGGNFTTFNGITANGIARWNGVAWSALGSGLSSSSEEIKAVCAMPNGDIVVGGSITMIGGQAAQGVARWNGAVWSALGTGVNSGSALAVLANGDLVVGGWFPSAGGLPVNNIARWNGAAWSALGSGVNSEVLCLRTMVGGDLFAGGYFALAGGVAANRVARWNGAVWSALAPGLNNQVYAFSPMPNGDIIAGGTFTGAGAVAANRVARWNGTAWSTLGSGASNGTDGIVRAMLPLPNGDLVVGGGFASAGGVTASNIARWNGTVWSALGPGLNGQVYALCALPNGDLVAGGSFTLTGVRPVSKIARWNGNAWSPLGTGVGGTSSANVAALATMPNGDVVAGGQFTTAGGNPAQLIARWNGTAWSPLGSGMTGTGIYPPTVAALTVLPNGELVAAGRFTVAGGVAASNIARWNGAVWAPFAGGVSSSVATLVALPDGGLMAGGGFGAAGLVAANNVARWDGIAWSALGQGLDGPVSALTMRANGTVVAGGNFARADNLLSVNFASLVSTCPAVAIAFGSGCTGSGGANTLNATSLPWTGSAFQAVATGMPANAIAVAVFGLGSGSTPLQSILPQGVPGCSLLVSPDLLLVHLPTVGAVATSLTIPNNVALAGQMVHHQVVPFEFDLAGNLIALTSTNAITLTIGTF